MNRVSAPVTPPSRTTASRLTASKYSSNPTRSRPPSASLNSLNYGPPVRSITASKCISELARLRPASSHDHGLQVHLPTRSIRAYKYIFKEGMRAVWRYRGNGGGKSDGEYIYSADHGVDRHHLISISSYHTMKIHTLSFPTFGLTRSVCDIVDPRNCVGSSTPGGIISSNPIPTLLEPELLFLMNSIWMS